MDKIREVVFGNKERVISAIVMIVALVVVLAIDSFVLMWLVLGVIYMLSLKEAMKLFDLADKKFVFGVGAITWIFAFFVPHLVYLGFLPAMVVASYKAYKNENMKSVLVFVYPTISIIFILALYKDFGVFSLVWLILVVAFTDTFAYFSGKYLGKTSFSSTSPNKTLEGVMGGVIAGSIIGSVAGLYFHGFLFSLCLSFLVSVFSVFGDLFESYLKRQANLKDSGNLFPGHGGILDRMDGYLFGVVVLYIGMALV
jgi:phosphatidate cytidylyltransferase